MAEAASQPAVVVTMEPSRWSFIHTDLVIENTGNAAAFDVRVEFDPPIQREVNGRSEDVPFNIISVLRPGYAIRNFVGNGSAFMEHSHRATVTWAGAPNSKHRERISYDVGLQHFEGVTMLGSGDPLVKVAEEMKKMREELQRHR